MSISNAYINLSRFDKNSSKAVESVNDVRKETTRSK
jgi:hypothetical protein